MKNWFNKNYKTLIIAAFLIPIITVAIVSISHVTQWYGISNPVSWSVYLSIGIEIAALSALAAISANMGSKVYFPFAIVTLVQFIGNIFFAYSYIDIDSKVFKDWVDLTSPFVEFLGVEPTDFVGHKRFLAFFAGGMLPIISLSFLHMLVKFTEEDRKKETETPKEETKIDASDLVAEISKVRLSERDLEILEKHLSNPPEPNEALKDAAKRYEENINKEKQRDLLVQMMENDQKLGLYDEPFDNPMIKNDELNEKLNEVQPETFKEEPTILNTEVVPALSDEEVKEMFMDEWERKFDMVEDEEDFSTIEPTQEEEEQNFSTIEPETENIFQEQEIKGEIIEVVEEPKTEETPIEETIQVPIVDFEIPIQEGWDKPEDDFDGFVPEPFATPEEVVLYNIDNVEVETPVDIQVEEKIDEVVPQEEVTEKKNS